MPQNAYESGERKVIPAVLIYARSSVSGGPSVLMIHKRTDFHAGRWNGLGGKLELDESPREAASREFAEESGLDLGEERFTPLGTLQFPNFKAHKSEDWLVFVFVADLDAREVQAVRPACAEGDLHWVPESQVAELNLWPGDRTFMPWVLARRAFVGTIWYRGAEVERHWVSPLA